MRVSAYFGFYGILSDPVVGYVRLAAIMVERGVRIIQLRMKDRPAEQALAVARSLRRLIPREHLLIINDDPWIAREAGADGVHLGQEDPPYHEAREILGARAVIGLSTHDPDQARAACALRPDYIGVGPVYPTTTKADHDPVIGLDGMSSMLQLATVPVVAIGGIDPSNVSRVLRAGARNVCAIGCINRSADPAAVLERMLTLIEEARAARDSA